MKFKIEGMIYMEFSSLVLMEREKETNFFVRELGSYQVDEGAEYITKLYYDGEMINLYFDTKEDVEEWQYTAIFDVFNEEVFTDKGYNIDTVDDEYNPTWLVKFNYSDEHSEVEDALKELCNLIKEEMETAFKNIQGKEEEYK